LWCTRSISDLCVFEGVSGADAMADRVEGISRLRLNLLSSLTLAHNQLSCFEISILLVGL
jgi:hypothetical protein